MKESEIKIIGRMTDESRDEFKKETVAKFDKEIEEILTNAKKYELPKNEEDLEMISRLNLWIEEYLKNIGGEGFVKKVDPEQIIILSDDDFVKIGRDIFDSDWSSYSGKMIPGVDIIFVKRLPETERFGIIVSLLHEVVHVNSKFRLNIFKNDERGGSRSGYSTKSVKKDKHNEFESYEYFDGLNEAIVQMTTLDILDKHTEELEKDYSITKKEQTAFRRQDIYVGYEYIFRIMIKKLAQEFNLSQMEYWKKFRRNLFTGDLMFLRDVEKVFGKGSLRVLSFMGAHASHAQNLELIKLFERYFLTDNQTERKEVAEKIFEKQEDEKYREKYKKRHNK